MNTHQLPLSRAIWLFPIVFALHNFEEALTLPRWSQTAGALHPPVGPIEFDFAICVLTALSVVVTSKAAGDGGRWLRAAAACWAVMLLNVLFPHLLATMLARSYTPGVLSALLLILPVNAYLLRRALREGVVSPRQLAGSTLAYGLLTVASLPVLFWMGRRLASAFIA